MNHAINFFRIVFTIIIALIHFNTISKMYLYSGYIVVEFFFIVSGYFLYYTYLNKGLNTISFFKKRFKQFWLRTAIVGILLSFFDYTNILNSNLNDICQHFSAIFAILGNTIIPFNDNIEAVYPIWYLAALLYGGAIIYAIIKGFPKQHKIIVSLLAFICYAIIFNCSTDVWTSPMPLIRGVAGISTGCLMYILINEYKNIVSGKLINLLSITAVVVSTLMLFYQEILGIIPIICYCFIIWACFTKESILYKLLNKSIFSKLSATSFEIFIGHMLVIKVVFFICAYIFNNQSLQNLATYEIIIISFIYIISLFIFAHFYQKSCNYIQRHLDTLL